ncbi:MAG: hypothetical protein NVSMB32_07630 [Actinomycetota bacterium]
MGFLEHHHEKKLEEAYHQALQAWQQDDQMLQRCLALIRSGPGAADGMVLKRGEGCFFTYRNSSLIESRRSQGHYVGGYSGFSFRIAKGVQYHVGGTRGHYVAGPDQPARIDSGTLFFTTQRLVFLGTRQNREWAFAKLLGYQHDPSAPRTLVAVSNRQKVSGFEYSAEHALLVHFVVALCLAAYQAQLPALEASMQGQVMEHQALRPPPPALGPSRGTA